MKKILSIIILAFLTTGFVRAQEPSSSIGYTPSSYYTFSWVTAFPIGSFHDWISQPGPAGFDFGGRYFIKNGLAVGFNFAWQRVTKLYEDETYTIPDKGIAITANNYRFTWFCPFQGVVAYHMIPDKTVSPFVSLGIGGDYMEHHLMIQEYDIYKTYWDFSLTPEVGITAKFGNFSNWGGILAFNYKFTTNKVELYEKSFNNLSMLNIRLGIAYIIR